MAKKTRQNGHQLESPSRSKTHVGQTAETVSCAASLILRSIMLSARLAAVMRRNLFKTANLNAEKLLHEVIFLRDKVAEVDGRNAILRSMLENRGRRRHPTLRERLSILWHMEYFQIPKRRVREYFSVSRSTLRGWIRHGIREAMTGREPANKTP